MANRIVAKELCFPVLGESKVSFADGLTTDQRVERAKAFTNRLIDHTRELIAAAENNAVVLYSDLLSAQIPKSYAANAFNEMRRSMQFYHLVRLCAVWDKAKSGRESIPTVVALLADSQVRNRLAEETYDYHASQAEPLSPTPTNDPVEADLLSAHWKSYCVRRAEEERDRVRRWLSFTTRIAPRVEARFLTNNLRPLRDGYLAHNLDPSADGVRSPAKLHYGDEAKLLSITVRVVDRLHLAINGTCFDWEAVRMHSKRNANEFWSSISFTASSRG